MKALQIGAGNIGRGFIGQLLYEAGWDLCFADINDELIQKLKAEQKYKVELAGEEQQIVQVDQVDAVHSAEEEEELLKRIAEADLITTAVGPNVLKGIAPALAAGLRKRLDAGAAPVNVIACENMAGATDQLKYYIFEHVTDEEQEQIAAFTGFANAAVDRIVPQQPAENELDVTVEPFFEWVVETPALKGGRPDIPSVTFVDDLTPYMERKLFTVNTGHAALAYHGFAADIETIKEAAEHPTVAEKLDKVLQETSVLLEQKHGFSTEEMEWYRSKITVRFRNPHISDSVERVGRGPVRKLGPNDRLVRPALELMERDITPEALAGVIAACLEFDVKEDPESVELQQKVQADGKKHTLAAYTGLVEDHPFIQKILSF
ncbi:mannitol-1-phosphate 5-dehydrogenase [Salibacterium halotolerans]|uniref:Mannitol-1-phosphate 5-dehydrogenase n=1 Tax=Salibacterium halotolerans TaxID=1884432 RepID=A0A1I5X1K0_9BACI|nr:mannitol-1-phosphate 5-dehydrogenase [Salibacterium halotolerans]SFQ25794.1 mannitol-1-phosphate 5-dehydrogenase [Salibacterium halotolerans]